jgi:D-alanine-D-alanine ligase-like ATP-grasp enzyme
VVALEIIEQPYFVGDGTRTVSELAAPRGSMDVRWPLVLAQDYLSWQGFRLDSVLADQQKAYLSFLYASPFHHKSREDSNVLQSVSDRVRFQLSRAAMLALKSFAPEHQKNVLYTLDGVLDAKDRVWFLEVNSHPMVHPSVYPHMLSALVFGT